MRRAVQYALDRRALADLDGPSLGESPAEVAGLRHRLGAYPLGGDLRTARKLTRGRKTRAVGYTLDDERAPSTTALREALAGIGILSGWTPAAESGFPIGGAAAGKAAGSGT